MKGERIVGAMAGNHIARVVSGGQTGADRAALDAAVAAGIPYGGWCPLGGWAEDLPEPPGLLAAYPQLRETPSPSPHQRTEWNVRDSDATLILWPAGTPSAGTELTLRLAEQMGRPVLVVDPGDDESARTVAAWLATLGRGITLNFRRTTGVARAGAVRGRTTVARAAASRLIAARSRPPGSAGGGRPPDGRGAWAISGGSSARADLGRVRGSGGGSGSRWAARSGWARRPSSTIRSRCVDQSGSGIGTAESSASV